jgi:phosphoglycerol transferase MdoB-like AlkP superfamily enzyme
MSLFKGNSYKIFFLRLAYVYLLFVICRLLFFTFNYSHFSDLSGSDLLWIFISGIRFDTVSIIVINSGFILLSLIPLNIRYNKHYQTILKYLFIITNSIGFAANLLDCGYFKFTMSRSTADLFNVLGLGNDFSSLFWQYVKDFWFLFVIWIIMILSTFYFYSKTVVVPAKQNLKTRKEKLIYFFYQLILFTFIIGLGIIGARGGFQLRPIGIVTAGNYTSSQNVALVLNTPFTMLKTIGKPGLKDVTYFDKKTALSYFNPLKSPSLRTAKNDNVVIIILESFSKEYIGSLNNNKGYTPFLDSLINNSLVFDHTFANGKRSIEAIPAILAGIPSLMSEAYITSKYSGNTFNSIATLLKQKGYYSSFFHGGTNGTMGFDNFINLAGFDKYYGRSEYNDEKDFDGKWGIYDEPFLQFFAKKLNETKQPFISSVFTLSSHHPYSVPQKYNGKFPKGKIEILQSIGYTDYALREFFKKVSTYSWFDNTLFIITADHTSESYTPEYQTRTGMYEIPLLFYKHNSNLKGINSTVAQQTDIMPSVLDYLGFDRKYVCFGNSLIDSTSAHFAVNFSDETFQIICDDFSLNFDGQNPTALYNIKIDPLLKNNLIKKNDSYASFLSNQVKSYIQCYNNRMIKNKMCN